MKEYVKGKKDIPTDYDSEIIAKVKHTFAASGELAFHVVESTPLVRCKDCEYYHPSYCEIWSKYGTIQTREPGFCYMAESEDKE